MNTVSIIGRLTASPEVRYSGSEPPKAICNFSLAVERRFKDADGNAITDFIDCVAFGKQAEFIGKWFDKGVRIGLSGELQTSLYEKDGQKHKAVKVVVSNVEFADGKREATTTTSNTTAPNTTVIDDSGDDFIPLSGDDDLPF